MGNCKNCRDWDKDEQFCLAAWPGLDTEPEENGFVLYANAADDQGLEAKLYTGPDFGCVQFRPKLAR